jgi:hypothetical protein
MSTSALITDSTNVLIEGDHCDQAFPGGISDMAEEHGYEFLIECARATKHRGRHTSLDGSSQWWGGKLTASEESRRDDLRDRLAASVGQE